MFIDYLRERNAIFVGEEEIAPTTGMPHVHIAFQLPEPVRFGTLLKKAVKMGIWLEPARSWPRATQYVQKGKINTPELYERGELRFFARGIMSLRNPMGQVVRGQYVLSERFDKRLTKENLGEISLQITHSSIIASYTQLTNIT